MNPAIPLLVIAWLLLSSPGTPAHSEDLELAAPLSAVTVFPEGALTEHQIRLQLPAGRSQVTMVLQDALSLDEPLPSIDQYRFSTEGCQLLQSSVRRVTTPPSNDLTDAHQRALEEQTRRVQSAQRTLESARSDLKMLDAMGHTMSEQVDLSDRDSMRTLHEFLAEQRRVATDTLVTHEHTLAAETEELLKLEKASEQVLRGTRRLQAELLVDAEVAGPVRLLATSFIETAGWTPEVRIARSSTVDNAQVSLLANVTNATTQDWREITLTISTDRLRDFTPLDRVTLATIDVRRTDEPTAESEKGPTTSSAPHSLQAIHTQSLPTTIERDQTKAMLLEQFETPCSLRYHARPTVHQDCHVLTTLRNETSQLIGAAPVSLFVDGTMTGRTSIEDIRPGAPFIITWGIRPNLQIDRELLERRSERTGLLGGGQRTTLRYRTTIRNLDQEPLELILEDRLPSTLSDDISVRGLEFTQPIEASEGEPEDRITWRLQIPASGTQATPTTVEWMVEITHSADLKTTPIPE